MTTNQEWNDKNNCKNCNSKHIVRLVAKCHDLCSVNIDSLNFDEHGYVPDHIGMRQHPRLFDKYISIKYCLNCGQIQGDWPAKILDQYDEY